MNVEEIIEKLKQWADELEKDSPRQVLLLEAARELHEMDFALDCEYYRRMEED